MNKLCKVYSIRLPRALLLTVIVVALTMMSFNVAFAKTDEAAETAISQYIEVRVADNDPKSIDSLRLEAEKIFTDMAFRYDYHPSQRTILLVYSNEEKFYEGSPSADAVGYAVPSENKIAIILGADLADLRTTIAHEINHIIFIKSVPRIDTVPQWFIEGLAIYESHPGISDAGSLEQQALAKDLPDIISRQPVSSIAEPKDYGQGYLLVGYIVRQFGRSALDGIIGELQSGRDFNSAVLKVLNTNPAELNANSKESVATDLIYVWLLKLQNIEWYLATVLFVVAGATAFMNKRKRLKNSPDDPDENESNDEPGSKSSTDEKNEYEGVDFGDGAIV
jgi:hypothetical protein